jgi:transglutaminase-like putative cysteine protease
MKRYQILHRTYYNFTDTVRLGAHTLLLRPRENHELRIESSVLDTTPPASLRWHRDVEDNSVAIATFDNQPARQLRIESQIVVQQYNEAPLDFVVADHAAYYPFAYIPHEASVLSPYVKVSAASAADRALIARWVGALWKAGDRIETYGLLQRVAAHIQQTLSYRLREEPGVQTAAATLAQGSGSCRDFAFLFMEGVRHLGLAARFVSGYLNSGPSAINFGATHAWAEVFLPGAGWKGFDPTLGKVVGSDHIAVAVSCSPESVPPVAGTFTGPPGAKLDVGVWVTPLP